MTETDALNALKTAQAKLDTALDSFKDMPSPAEVFAGTAKYKGKTGEEAFDLLRETQVETGIEIGALRQQIVQFRVVANKGEIERLHSEICNEITLLLEGLDAEYEKLGPDPIHTVVYTRTFVDNPDGVDANGPVTAIQINPQSTRKSSGGNGGGKIASRMVTRTVDGVIETMTVKEAVHKYGDRAKTFSSWAKNNWGFIFNKQNPDWANPFEFVTEETNNPEKPDNKTEAEESSEEPKKAKS